MEGILAFDNDTFDISLLDRTVQAFYQGSGAEQQQAQRILTQFQEHPDAWTRVDAILEGSQAAQTRYIALQILDKLIQTRWKVLPTEQRQGIRNYVVAVIIKTSSDEQTLLQEKTFINKLNLTLVQILKQEWPRSWPTFIPEIVNSSRASLSLCENNLRILKLLSEEIFDYSAEQMTQSKTKNLKNQMCGEFSEIFQLCSEVLEKAQKPSLIKATLETLLRFLNWIPLGYIFETNIIENLRNRFLEVPEFRNITLKCLTEIAGLDVSQQYDDKFVTMLTLGLASVNTIIPINTNLQSAYETSNSNDQEFVQNLALFLSTFLGTHLKLIETKVPRDMVINAHQYLVKISEVDDREIFKICLEYWSKLVCELYEEVQALPVTDINPMFNLSLSGSFSNGLPTAGVQDNPNLRKYIYAEVLSRLRLVMIEKMVKPEEVLIVENDEGEIVREFVKESDTITLYKSMRECLVYLTHLDVNDTEIIMSDKLSKQVDGSEWSWVNLNTLCWAIGSISGAMNEETEKRFLVTVIKDLLGLCEMKRGKDNKAVVASNIMYIVGQYPRFLKAHWKFLKTVVNKLFEFMHELHEGVQDMACDTFIKIAQKCRRHFVAQQTGEHEPFIDEIIRNLDKITSELQPLQIHTFYEACGYMISAQPQKPVQERLIANLMATPNAWWDKIISQAGQNIEVLNENETIKMIGNIMKTNVSACTSIGPYFYPQIARIYMDLLGLYKAVGEIISNTVAQQGAIATKTPRVRALRTVRKEILKLIETYVNKADDLDAVNQNLMPPLFDAVLADYNRNLPDARDAEVLNCMTTIIDRLGPIVVEKVPLILDAIFEPTLNMISKDFSEYPEHRAELFKMLRSVNQNCFPALLTLPQAQFKMFCDSVVWAFKHVSRDIAETGLSIAYELIDNFANKTDQNTSNGFYSIYFLPLLQDIFFVLTDTDHKSGFKLQAAVLARMFNIVESGQVQAPLFNPQSVTDPNITNAHFLREYVVNLLRNAFQHLQPAQVELFVRGLFSLNQDLIKFKQNLRDFLVQLKEFAGEDNADLYLEEREQELDAAQKAEQERRLNIPGLLKPSELPMHMEEEN
ncbi:Exportin-1 [Neolecta irregularis DAH-3]|uniref:Exportin-1 n=1 Tax=Neolecta irregularis (strain DAH-3) TaxID=1198029 RepID=A0A1U7LJX5_NEOID|nr:Exportin-1 [Neolecta irregularis DAH-3]|eukprot:OLL22893.1 Exportin-1 [Neolecta irregularis DAH-3]